MPTGKKDTRSKYREYWSFTHPEARDYLYPDGIPYDDRTFITQYDLDNNRPATRQNQPFVKDLKSIYGKIKDPDRNSLLEFARHGTSHLERLQHDQLKWKIKITDPEYVKTSNAYYQSVKAKLEHKRKKQEELEKKKFIRTENRKNKLRDP